MALTSSLGLGFSFRKGHCIRELEEGRESFLAAASRSSSSCLLVNMLRWIREEACAQMRSHLVGHLFVILLAMSLFLGTCTAHKLHVEMELSKEPLTALARFGFDKNGWVEVNLSHIDVYRSESYGPTDKSQIGILLAGYSAESQLQSFVKRMKSDGDPGLCILTETKVQKLLDMVDPGKAVKGPDGDQFTALHEVEEPGYLTLYLANCACRHHAVSFKMDVSLFNEEGTKGGKRNYVSSGRRHLAVLYFVVFAIYFIACCVWQYLIWQKHQDAPLKRILHLLGLLLGAYMLVLWSHGTYYSVLRRTGVANGWRTANHFFTIANGIALLAFILLGLPDIELNVSDIELKLLIGCLSGLVVSWTHNEVSHHTSHSTSPLASTECEGVHHFFTLLNVISLVGLSGLVVVACFPWVTQQKPMSSSLMAKFSFSSPDGDGGVPPGWSQKLYVKASLYAACVWLVVWLLRIFTNHHHAWIVVMFKELGVLGFFAAALLTFRPGSTENYHVRLSGLDEFEEEELTVRGNEEVDEAF